MPPADCAMAELDEAIAQTTITNQRINDFRMCFPTRPEVVVPNVRQMEPFTIHASPLSTCAMHCIF